VTHADELDELILRTLVLQFDGRVLEIFGSSSGDAIRCHVALLTEPQIDGPNRKGRFTGKYMVLIGGNIFAIDADEMELLRPFLSRVSVAIAEYRRGGGAAR
jgi:hypothetical protein